MNPEEKTPKSLEPYEQDRIGEAQSETLSLSPESRKVLEELELELKNLQDRLGSPNIQKIPFTEPGGEQDIAKQMIAIQRERLPQIFEDTDFESSHLSTHNIQKEKFSCQLASVNNVFKALGIEISEKEIAEEVGKSGESANVWPEELTEYLKSKGLDVFKISNTLEAIDALAKGGKIVLPLLPPKYPISHAVIISGVRIDHGKIEFYVNDPQYKSYAEILSLNDLVDVIIPYSFHKITPTYVVLKRSLDQDVPSE